MPGPTTPLAAPAVAPAASQLLWVFLAGGLGASLRVGLGTWVDTHWSDRLPFIGTLTVNLLGCFGVGLAAALLPAGTARTAVVGGLLGGFTTFSALALFSHQLLRDAKLGLLAVQVTTHLVVGVLCVAAGFALGRVLVPGPPP